MIIIYPSGQFIYCFRLLRLGDKPKSVEDHDTKKDRNKCYKMWKIYTILYKIQDIYRIYFK